MFRLTRSILYVSSTVKVVIPRHQQMSSLKEGSLRHFSGAHVSNSIFFKKGSQEIDPQILAKINKRPDPPTKDELEKNEQMRNADIGFKAAPAPFKAIVKIMVFGVSILIAIKYFINDKKNIKYKSDSQTNAKSDEEYVNMATVKPGLPIGPSDAVRKSEYEGSGSSYTSRKSGDRLTKW